MKRITALALGLTASFMTLSVAVHADVQTGVQKYQAGDYGGAIAEWLPYAAQNEPNALFNLGQAYRLGRGVAPDLKIAVDYYERAAALGHVSAQANLGSIYYFAEPPLANRKRAIELWQAAAARGEPRALYMLGVLHFNGEAVARDWPRAYAYTEAAAKASLPEAEEALAEMSRHVSADDKRRASHIVVATAPEEPALPSPPPPHGVRVGYGDEPTSPAATPADKPPTVAVTYGTDAPALPAAVAAPSPRAAPPPGRTAASATPDGATAAAGDWRLQVGAFRSRDSAAQGWAQLQARHRDSLRGLAPTYAPAPDGSVVRLQVGPFAGRAEANARCAILSRAGLACFALRVTSN
ncbi:SPOR domain-containing protein [Parapedomonas caeni]